MPDCLALLISFVFTSLNKILPIIESTETSLLLILKPPVMQLPQDAWQNLVIRLNC